MCKHGFAPVIQRFVLSLSKDLYRHARWFDWLTTNGIQVRPERIYSGQQFPRLVAIFLHLNLQRIEIVELLLSAQEMVQFNLDCLAIKIF